MAARTTGFGLLASSSVQVAQDLALVSHAATLESRVPFIHFFDGFRTSHEVSKIDLVSYDQIREMIDNDLVYEHRRRALEPGQSVHSRYGSEPGRIFPGTRKRQHVLPEDSRDRAGHDG